MCIADSSHDLMQALNLSDGASYIKTVSIFVLFHEVVLTCRTLSMQDLRWQAVLKNQLTLSLKNLYRKHIIEGQPWSLLPAYNKDI